MTTKEALHRLVDELSEPESSTAATVLIRLHQGQRLQPDDVSEETILRLVDLLHDLWQSTKVVRSDVSESQAWSRLSVPAFARDWESEEDAIYDDEPS